MRMLLSMPFSLLTCSITRFRSCCILTAPVVLVIGFFNSRKRNLNAGSVLFQSDLISHDLFEHSEKGTAAIDLFASPHADTLTNETGEVLGGFQGTINAGGGNFEGISARDDILAVEALAQMPAHPAQIIDVRSAFLIEVDSQDSAAAASLMLQFDIDDLHSFSLSERRRELPNSRDRGVHSR